MVVQHNIASMNANRYYNINNSGLAKSLEKLSSGFAINRAGDNAAGLAVSEKMRSQIGGLTQGVKNAQDGISMIQTYEGALTETDSILQRMKTLADQAANGTYQDDVDRDAIQLEFNQLNDELDQIADTDFNGVVMLNGGQMADGTKAVDGKFDYGNRTPRQLIASDVNQVDYQKFDDTNNTTNANAAWSKINSNWDRTDGNTANDGPESIDVELKYNADDKKWSVISANNGATIDSFEVTAGGTTSNNGGFTLTTKTGGVEIANVTIDTSKLVNGDTITLTLNNPAAGATPPQNMTSVASSVNFDEKSGSKDLKLVDANLTTTVNDALTSTDITKGVNDAFNALNGANITVEYKSATAAGDDATMGPKATLTIGGRDYEIDMSATTAATAGKTLKLDDGTELVYSVDTASAKGNNPAITFYAGNSATVANDTKLATITFTNSDEASKSSGKVSYKLGLDYNNFNASAKPSVVVKDPTEGNVSKSNSYSQASAPLTYTDHLTLQAGARTKDSVDFTFKYQSNGLGDLKSNLDCSSREDGLGTKNLSLLTQKDANYAIDRIDNAINKVSMVRATFGATQNRLEHKIDNMNVTKENITSAESRIRDTDVSEEMANFTKNQILSQASQSMLAQANSLPQNVLQLLG